MSDATSFDHHMMGIALTMARRGLGQTAPNPSVGAVLVDPLTREVLARATTAAGGRPHAETAAIARAGPRTRGATLYVTLEPCSHTGQTAPCADAVIAAGIRRVVCAVEDPDPRVAGRGLDRLRAAGIEVVRGVRRDEAHWLTLGHILRVCERRPFVCLKIAIGTDGEVPHGAHGRPVFVTGVEARAHGHLLRAQADAILVGAGTLRSDDPTLTCRLPGMAARSPRPVVLGGTVDELARSKLGCGAAAPGILWYGTDRNDARPRTPNPNRSSGHRGVRLPVIAGRLWLPAVMEDLAALGVTRLLVEGGPIVWRSFADAFLVDEVALYSAGGGSDVAYAALTRLLGTIPLTLHETRRFGSDTLYRLRRLNR